MPIKTKYKNAGEQEIKEYPEYGVGDLVKIYDGHQRYYWRWHGEDEDLEEETYGIVIGRTLSWYEAYKETTIADANVYSEATKIGSMYWDNVNYAPYKVMTLNGNVEWVSPEHMTLIS